LETIQYFRNSLFTEIHEIVFYGNGGYSWEEVYKMPKWLRKFTHDKILKHIQAKNSTNMDDVVASSIKNMKEAGSINADYKTTIRKKSK